MESGRSRLSPCLALTLIQNLLREALYFNYEYYLDKGEGAFRNSEIVVRYHVGKLVVFSITLHEVLKSWSGHCLDMLRQQLMCTADTGVLGQVWIAGPEPFVDFNTNHKCRNFEAVRQWAENHQMQDLPPDYLAKPQPGDEIWPEIP
jgi:hypothetical protein